MKDSTTRGDAATQPDTCLTNNIVVYPAIAGILDRQLRFLIPSFTVIADKQARLNLKAK